MLAARRAAATAAGRPVYFLQRWRCTCSLFYLRDMMLIGAQCSAIPSSPLLTGLRQMHRRLSLHRWQRLRELDVRGRHARRRRRATRSLRATDRGAVNKSVDLSQRQSERKPNVGSQREPD